MHVMKIEKHFYVQTFNRGQHNWTFSMIYNMTFLKVLDVKVVPPPYLIEFSLQIWMIQIM